MGMVHTQINGYIPLRQQGDVTADDTAFTLDTAGTNKITDITRRDFLELDSAWNGGEMVFWAEGVENDTFGVELWGIGRGPYGLQIGQLMADITGALGTMIADVSNVSNRDSTSRLFADDVSISEQHHAKSIGIADQGNNRMAKISTDFAGLWGLYARFYNVGGAGEAERINMWMRPY